MASTKGRLERLVHDDGVDRAVLNLVTNPLASFVMVEVLVRGRQYVLSVGLLECVGDDVDDIWMLGQFGDGLEQDGGVWAAAVDREEFKGRWGHTSRRPGRRIANEGDVEVL